MKTLYTLAFPTLAAEDAQWIEAFRQRHDPHCDVVAAHFTMVFATSRVAEHTYTKHVEAIARTWKPIPFVCRYAMLGTDAGASRAYTYLVPDEGYSDLSRLHDALYRGCLAESLRLDIPYVPHITLGSCDSGVQAKRQCDELNEQGVLVKGVVHALRVAAVEQNRLSTLNTIKLGD